MPTLNWIGKEAVVEHHKDVPFHLLREVPELSVGEPGSGNLLIQGDNLLALKALLPYYAGKVKCIYIDPPYNTGNEKWVYNDNVNSPEIRDWLGKVVGGEAEDLSRHDKWLCMMYPRIVLLRELLHEEGSLWMSIDDNEVQHAKIILNEIFGKRNFVASVTVRANPRGRQSDSYVASLHDYCICYAKNKNLLTLNGLTLSEEKRKEYNKTDGNGKLWRELGLRQRGSESLRTDRPDMFFPIFVSPEDGTVSLNLSAKHHICVTPKKSNGVEGRWMWGKEKVEIEITRQSVYGRMVKGKKVRFDIFIKDYLEKDNEERTAKSKSIWDEKEMNTELGGVLLKNILGSKKFPYPKPVGLLKRIILMACGQEGIVIDSFAGSGTTGHAVMQINREDGGNRRFILIEMEKDVAQNVAAQRVKKVVEGYSWEGQLGKVTDIEGLGGGFRYCKLDAPLFGADGQIQSKVTFNDLARHVFFTETGEPLPNDFEATSPLLGALNGQAVYLLFNGILGDKSESGGNVLTRQILAKLPPYEGPKIIYGEGCLLSKAFLQSENITFRQLPYEVRVH